MAKQSAGGHLVVRRARAGQKIAVIENVTIWKKTTWEAYADHGDDSHIVTGSEKYVADTINLNDYYLWQGKATDTNDYYSVFALIYKIEITSDNKKKLYLRTKYYTIAKKGDTGDPGDDALQYTIEVDNETPNITNGAVKVKLTAYTQLGKQQRQQATLVAGKLWWDVNQTSNITNPLEVSVSSELTVNLRTTDGIVATKHVTPVKDGSQGIQGCIVRVSEWVVGVEYHNDEALTTGTRYLDIAVVTTGASTFKAYKCRVTHTATEDNAPVAGTTTTQWEPFNTMAPIYTPLILAAQALIRLMQTNQLLVMKADGTTVNAGMGGGDIPMWVGSTDPSKAPFYVDADGHLHATGVTVEGEVNATSGTFSGNVKGVTGTFYKLSALDSNGKEACSMYFSSDGHLTFEGDIYNQGYDNSKGRSYRFYTSDVMCRGIFGHNARYTAVVKGTYMQVYPKGISKAYITVSLESGKTSDGTTYYKIPLYSPGSGDASGMPVDMVIFNTSADYYYAFTDAGTGKGWDVLNANDEQKIHICDTGGWGSISGGMCLHYFYVDKSFISPTPATDSIAPGIFHTGAQDINWA